MSDHVRVNGAKLYDEAPCLIEVDEYVPIRFRSYAEPLGSVYLRLGNFSTTLVELIVDPASHVLRGLTITSFETIDDWPAWTVADRMRGLPIVANPLDETRRRVDLVRDFRVALRDDALLLSWEPLDRPVSELSFGKLDFLVADGLLCGVQLKGLSSDQVELVRGHVRK